MSNAYCSMIHGGLHLVFHNNKFTAQHCCLRRELFDIDVDTNFWNDNKFIPLRTQNLQNKWDSKCNNCLNLETAGFDSERTGMNTGLQLFEKTQLSGPARIDLMFDISCNLACRTCSPELSTFWQKHLQQHNLWNDPISASASSQAVIAALAKLDLSNLRMLVFCGGETLLGQEYWKVAEWLANTVPNAKQQLTVCFQTNGTQAISQRNYQTIEKLHLVKLHVSLDGVGDRFEYLRWPATWSQVTDNIFKIRESAPSNVMFLIEETISIFNLYYLDELKTWAQTNFATNREGDITNHTQHLAWGRFDLAQMTQDYVDNVTDRSDLIPKDWKENPVSIAAMIDKIKMFDQYRGQSFETTFPEVAQYYNRYLK